MNLKQLLGICEHKWKNVSAFEILKTPIAINGRDLLPERESHSHNVYVLQCEKCGNVKSKKI